VEAVDHRPALRASELHRHPTGCGWQGGMCRRANRAAVIVSPGGRGPVAHDRGCSRAHGYCVLLFDRRGEGESEGDFNAYGWGGDADLKAAASFLARRADVDPRADRWPRPLRRRRDDARSRRRRPAATRPSCPRAERAVRARGVGTTPNLPQCGSRSPRR
jgi:hypothetical protein